MSRVYVAAGALLFLACAAAEEPRFQDSTGNHPGQEEPPPALGQNTEAPRCGDQTCDATESCTTCPTDCGQCPKCALAPSCTSAVSVPASTAHQTNLDIKEDSPSKSSSKDNGAAAAGCLDAQLRMRVKKLKVNKGGGEAYCVVTASDGVGSEVAMTPKTRNLGKGDEHYFDPKASMFWGAGGLRATMNNLTITYNCFRVKSDAWAKVFKAIGNAAGDVGALAGDYGWAFGLGEVAADAAAAGIKAASGDELRLNAQQTIHRNELLSLTNGKYWTIKKEGGDFLYPWEWELTVETWGCADAISVPR